MIVVRSRQLLALQSVARRKIEEEAFEYIRSTFPQAFEARGEEATRALVAASAQRAEAWGLPCGSDVLALASLSIVLGDDFAERPEHGWMHEIIASDVVDGAEKMKMVLAR